MAKTIMFKHLDDNIGKIKEILTDCDDIIYRDFFVGEKQQYKFVIIYTDGLADKSLISDYVLESLMHQARELPPNLTVVKDDLYKLVYKGNVAITDAKETEYIEEIIDNVLMGETVLLIDGYDKALIVSSRGWPTRGISEPQTEIVIRGPRDGFVETGKINTTLIRRRIRDPKLKLKTMQIGKMSKTDIAIMYIEDIVDKEMLKELNKKLESINIDAILESSYIEQLIENSWWSLFPQVESTERPDAVAASLYEGRIAIIVDNTPFVLLVPMTLNMAMQSSEDYYDRWIVTATLRIARYIAAPIVLLLPALYIAITSFHPGMIPTQLALYVASTRLDVPFPAFVEAIIMMGTLELLRESGTRISGPIGTTIGIVGGLIIGQAAVEAGIVSPLMVIIVAITTISSFTLPNYSFATGLRIASFGMMILASSLGLYGVMLGNILILTHLVGLKSLGVPYMMPYSSVVHGIGCMKDTIIRAPLKYMKKRPAFTRSKNKTRMR